MQNSRGYALSALYFVMEFLSFGMALVQHECLKTAQIY